MILFPAIDLIDGKCVRLKQGDFAQQSNYQQDPVQLALSWEQQGAKYLHLVDLDGARTGLPQNISVLEKISAATKLEVDFGGGLSCKDAIVSVLNSGAKKVNLGSLAIKNSELFSDLLEEFTDQIILSMDLKEGYVAINGWQQQSEIQASELINRFNKLKFVSVTDISKDGMLQGPNFKLYQQLVNDFKSISFIASGGVSCFDDLVKLKNIGLYGCIAGKAILEGRFTVEQAIKGLEC